MANLEKVIKGLGCCKIPFSKCYDGGCPYFEDEGCKAKLKREALELLKAQKLQEPRVMTLEEVMATPKDIAIWQELRDELDYKFEISPVAEPSEITIDWFYLEPQEPLIGIRFAGEGYMPKETYGKSWRCWTSRPTNEQIKEAPWESNNKE